MPAEKTTLPFHRALLQRCLASRPVQLTGRLIRTAVQSYAWLLLTVLVSIFYIYHTIAVRWYWQILILLPAIASNVIVLYYGQRWLKRRLSSTTGHATAVSVTAGLCLLLFLSDFRQHPWWLALLPALYFTWVLWNYWRDNRGLLYVGLLGVGLFALVVFSYRLLYLEIRGLLFAFYWNERMAMLAELQEQAAEWDCDTETRICKLIRADHAIIQFRIPAGTYFHDARLTGFAYEVPHPGTVLAYISHSKSDPFARPAAAISVTPNADIARAADLRDEIEITLQHRRQAGEIDDIQYLGEPALDDLKLPAINDTQAPDSNATNEDSAHTATPDIDATDADDADSNMEGPGADAYSAIRWQYRDLIFAENVRLTIILSPPTPSGYRWIILMEGPVESVFPLHPTFYTLLESMRF
ncbi:MAG: hypothetical protein KDK30_10705 [Leptospiraceae bacterium]|nr:hypothetical protein [Leptospiraceae bacterium]MCB1315404.1 hypothetical protein [Leptospiraceae bacterium]